jgi:DNA-binding winged helix-turn-helix (wHTH) protein/Tol biopolymer transport system component
LTRENKRVALGGKTFDLLLLFVESRGRVLTRAELLRALWPDIFVEESNLSFQISALRKALGDQGAEWIETVHKYGYRFAVPVIEIATQPLSNEQTAVAHEQATTPDEHGEISKELRADSEGPVEVEPAQVAPIEARWFQRLATWRLLSAATAIAAIILAVAHFREATPIPQRTIRFLVQSPEKINFVSPSISPDGKWLTLIGLAPDGERRLWVRDVGSIKAEPLAGTELVDSVFWSPDSRSIGFFANGKLKTMTLRGPPVTLCDAPGSGGAGSWSRQGLILFQTRAHRELYRVSVSGGVPEQATTLDALHQETAHYAPQFLPDGRHFIYFVQSLQPEHAGIFVGSLDSKKSTYLLNSNGNAMYAESSNGTGYLLFTSGTTLMGRVFNATRLQLVGEPFPVVQHLLVTLASGLNHGIFSASQNGVLVYRAGTETPSTELVWFDRHGQRLGTVGEPANYSNPALSPDNKMLAVSREDALSVTRDIWIFNLEHGTSSRVTFEPTDETCAIWSPDSSRIAYSAANKGVFDIYQKIVTSTSKPELLFESSENKFVQGWSPDRRFIAFTTTGSGIWMLSLVAPYPSKTPLGEKRSRASPNLEISPDGRWIAYQLDGPIRSEVYVERLEPPNGEWQVSTSGGIEPHWRRDGGELYYIAENKLMAVEVKTDSPAFEAAIQKTLFDVKLGTVARRNQYQVSSDGQRFLINTPLEPPTPVTVIVNWTADARP